MSTLNLTNEPSTDEKNLSPDKASFLALFSVGVNTAITSVLGDVAVTLKRSAPTESTESKRSDRDDGGAHHAAPLVPPAQKGVPPQQTRTTHDA